MGTCSSVYIEFKKRSDKQWYLLEAVVPLDYRDWRWGKSWCTLTELQAYLDERLEKCKVSILREHAKQLSYGISDKLDAILTAVSGKAMKPVKEEDDDLDRGEMLEYYLGEEFDEILWLKGFAAGIALIHEFLTDEWFSEESVRLVFYSC